MGLLTVVSVLAFEGLARWRSYAVSLELGAAEGLGGDVEARLVAAL